jgi:hypothetical protein
MTTSQDRRHPVYAEDFCALRWPLLAWGLVVPSAILLAGAVLAILDSDVLWLPVALFVAFFSWGFGNGGLLQRHWRSSIRIDERGIRIGAARKAEREPDWRPRDKPPIPAAQARRLFTCDWPGVIGMRVVTDRTELRELRKELHDVEIAMRYLRSPGASAASWPAGVLICPYMRAALVVEIDLGRAHVEYPDVLFPPHRSRHDQLHNVNHTVWLAPTRRPERLRRALGGLPQGADQGRRGDGGDDDEEEGGSGQ